MRPMRVVALSAAVLMVGVATATTVGADPAPVEGLTLHMTCGSEEFDVVSPAPRAWTPALAVGSNKVVIVLAYLELHEVVYDDTGSVVDETHDFTVLAKGQSGKQHGTVCDYAYHDVANPALPPGYEVVGNAVVIAVVRGR